MKTPWVSGRVNSCHIRSISLRWLQFPAECIHSFMDTIAVRLRLMHLNLIITIQSWKVLKMVLCKVKDFFDSDFNVSMIKRWALPKGIITKLIGDTKLVRTLAGHLKKVVTMQDLRLPEFDKNMHINQQMVLLFDNDNLKYNITLGTNLLSKSGIKLNYSEGPWNGLVTPSHFVHL